MTEFRKLTRAELRPVFTVVEHGACYRLQASDFTFEVDRIVWRHGECSGELMVRTDLRGTDAVNGVLHVATFNLSNARARTERARQLEAAAKAPEIPMLALLEEFCQCVLAAERTGDDAVVLRDVQRTDDDERVVHVSGFALPWLHPSILFGDGGVCKSYLALYLAGRMAEEGTRVLVADWELDASDHRDRLGRLFGNDMPASVFYTRCARPLIYDLDRLKRIVRQQAIGYAVLDSIGFAVSDAPETAEAALGYFRAVRQLGIGTMHIAHVSKAEQGDQKPFGSAFFHNSARACWNLKATDDTGALTLGVFCRKSNLRARQAPFSLDVTFSDTRTTFTRGEIAEVAEFAPQLSITQRVRTLLRAGAKTRDEIAEALDAKPDSIRRIVDRSVKLGHLVKLTGANGGGRIGLPARVSV